MSFSVIFCVSFKFILLPRTPDIIAYWQVVPPVRPPSQWLPHNDFNTTMLLLSRYSEHGMTQ